MIYIRPLLNSAVASIVNEENTWELKADRTDHGWRQRTIPPQFFRELLRPDIT